MKRLRMERAALLLRNTTLSVEEIAPMLGYGNQSNFYKAFNRIITPAPGNTFGSWPVFDTWAYYLVPQIWERFV